MLLNDLIHLLAYVPHSFLLQSKNLRTNSPLMYHFKYLSFFLLNCYFFFIETHVMCFCIHQNLVCKQCDLILCSEMNMCVDAKGHHFQYTSTNLVLLFYILRI